MKKGFSLVELMIVVAVLGILAAMTLPRFEGHVARAKAAAARDNLRLLRQAIELYASQHNDIPPGYTNGSTEKPPLASEVVNQLTKATTADGKHDVAGANLGPYLTDIPKNPLNDSDIIQIRQNNLAAVMPGPAGWLYDPENKQIKLNYPGTDPDGVSYFDY